MHFWSSMKKTQLEKGVKAPQIQSFTTVQVDLFQDFLFNTQKEKNTLSNTIDLWDCLPKYAVSQVEQNKLRTDQGLLPMLTRKVRFMGDEYEIFISPALLSDEKGKAYYPSANEELVENALRRLATLQNHCFHEASAKFCGVSFTLYELIEELKLHKHARSYVEVVKSLKILAGASIEIKSKSGRGVSIDKFIRLSGFTEEERLSNPFSKWIVYFHPLIFRAMETISYRQFDYEKMMTLKPPLGRWLYKRLAHYYTNAGMTVPIILSLTQIQHESGFLNRNRTNNAVKELTEVFDLLQKIDVFNNVEVINDQRGPRNKIIDITYRVFPHEQFVANVKRANKRQADNREKLISLPEN